MIIIPLAMLALTACKSEAQKTADEVKSAVTADFKDPASSQFRNLKVKLASLCGEVNSKNSYGAYTGFKRFHGSGPGGIISEWKIEEGTAIDQSESGKKFWADQADDFDREYRDCQATGETVT